MSINSNAVSKTDMSAVERITRLGYPRLTDITVEITTSCNLLCSHCYLSPEVRSNASSHIKIEDFKSWLPSLCKVSSRTLRISGGEPLLHQDFRAFVACIKKAGLQMVLFTNATLLDKEIIRFLRSYLPKEIIISLYGSTEQEYDALATEPTGNYLVRIRNAVTLLKKFQIPYKLQCRPLCGNQDLPQKLRSGVFPGEKICVGHWVVPRSFNDATNMDEMVPREAWTKKEFRQVGTRYHHPELNQELVQYRLRAGCGAALVTAHITANGNVKPCAFIGAAPVFSLHRKSFEDIFFGESFAFWCQPISQASPCFACAQIGACRRCVAMGYGSDAAVQARKLLCATAAEDICI